MMLLNSLQSQTDVIFIGNHTNIACLSRSNILSCVEKWILQSNWSLLQKTFMLFAYLQRLESGQILICVFRKLKQWVVGAMNNTFRETLQVRVIKYPFIILITLMRLLIQDFGEGGTTHGIKYILERGQPFLHRLLWLLIVISGVSTWDCFVDILCHGQTNWWSYDYQTTFDNE